MERLDRQRLELPYVSAAMVVAAHKARVPSLARVPSVAAAVCMCRTEPTERSRAGRVAVWTVSQH